MERYPPRRFLLILAIVGTALVWVTAPDSQAQNLYVANQGNAKVEEYNATTGASIKSPLIGNTQSNQPTSIAILGNDLYVGEGVIAEYDATTGALLSGTFATYNGDPQYLVETGGNLFAAGQGGSTLEEYNASTGVTESTNFLNTRISQGFFGLAVSGNNLYVAQPGSISVYDATTGSPGNPDLVTTTGETQSMVISGNVLYVGAFNSESGADLEAYNATTGAPISTFTSPTNLPTAPQGLAVVGNDIYATFDTNYINVYNATTGALISGSFITTGLAQAGPIVVSPVPEPAAIPLLACGLFALAGVQSARLRASGRL
jgi:hypothetical protein